MSVEDTGKRRGTFPEFCVALQFSSFYIQHSQWIVRKLSRIPTQVSGSFNNPFCPRSLIPITDFFSTWETMFWPPVLTTVFGPALKYQSWIVLALHVCLFIFITVSDISGFWTKISHREQLKHLALIFVTVLYAKSQC